MTREPCPPKLQRRRVAITNRHPRLKVPRAAVAHAIALLDAGFKILPGDRRYLSLGRNHKSKIIKQKSPVPPGELSLVFLTDPALARIHADFMDDPTATDVITFEGDAIAGLAGEICVSADTAARYVGLVEGSRPCEPGIAEGRSPALQNSRPAETRALQEKFATELTLYVVHGWLHLAGYDDLVPAKKRRMRAAEARAMKLLAAAQAIPAFRLK